MTRLEALRALYDAVKAGTAPQYSFFKERRHHGVWTHALGDNAEKASAATQGSVDAALAFIAATLPDAGVEDISQSRDDALWRVSIFGVDHRSTAQHAQLSVALLLAGLAALIAEEMAT